MRTHSDWFDENGYFIGYIPRIIWRPVARGFSDFHEIKEYVSEIGFTVDRELAIRHMNAASLWKRRELISWGDEALTVEIFIKVCNAIFDDARFELLDPNTMENI